MAVQSWACCSQGFGVWFVTEAALSSKGRLMGRPFFVRALISMGILMLRFRIVFVFFWYNHAYNE